MIPYEPHTLRERARSAHFPLGGVVHDDHGRPFVAVEVKQIEDGAIDGRSVTDGINGGFGGGVVPERIFHRDGADLGAAARDLRGEENQKGHKGNSHPVRRIARGLSNPR